MSEGLQTDEDREIINNKITLFNLLRSVKNPINTPCMGQKGGENGVNTWYFGKKKWRVRRDAVDKLDVDNYVNKPKLPQT